MTGLASDLLAVPVSALPSVGSGEVVACAAAAIGRHSNAKNHPPTHPHPHPHRQTNRQTNRQTDKQTDRQPDRQTDRQTETHTHTHTREVFVVESPCESQRTSAVGPAARGLSPSSCRRKMRSLRPSCVERTVCCSQWCASMRISHPHSLSLFFFFFFRGIGEASALLGPKPYPRAPLSVSLIPLPWVESHQVESKRTQYPGSKNG